MNKRAKKILIRAYEAEIRCFKEAAKAAGVSMSEWLRSAGHAKYLEYLASNAKDRNDDDDTQKPRRLP